MTEIKDHTGKLLHIIFRKEDMQPGRTDIAPPEQFLQCAALKLQKATMFRSHQHVWHRTNNDRIAQESWVCIKGSVKVFLYDLNRLLVHTDIIQAGEISMTFEGGHNYLLIEDSIVYEFKTGPYLGQEFDKKFI